MLRAVVRWWSGFCEASCFYYGSFHVTLAGQNLGDCHYETKQFNHSILHAITNNIDSDLNTFWNLNT